VRIGTGNFRALRYTWRLLSPTAGWIALSFWSHKILRWLVPFALIGVMVSSVALARDPFFMATALAGATFCALAGAGFLLEGRAGNSLLLKVPYYSLSMNLALALGLVSCLSGRRMTI